MNPLTSTGNNNPVESDDDREWEESQREWQEEYEARRRKIFLAPKVSQQLEALKQDGADPDKILWGLALVASDTQESLTQFFGSRYRHYTALANKLERVSDEFKVTLSNPSNCSDLFRASLFPDLFSNWTGVDGREKLSIAARRRVKPILDLLREEARRFRLLEKNYLRFMRQRALGGLLKHVKDSTGQFHDDRMADILQAAHDVFGVKAVFTAEMLRKLRQRKYPGVIRKRRTSEFLALHDLPGTLGIPLGGLDKINPQK